MQAFKRLMQVIFLMGIVLVLGLGGSAEARDLKASLGHFPLLSESKDKGLLVDLIKAMNELYTEGTITIDIYPSARSIDNVIKGSHDFHMPLLVNSYANKDELPFAYSENIFDAVFALYTNKNNKEINPGNVGKFKIETDAALTRHFGFPARPSMSIEGSLKKVDMGRIDGYIFAMPETDMILKQLNLNNIKRWNFRTIPAAIIVPKGQKGKEIESILSPLLRQLKENGTYQKIMAPVLNVQFKEW